MTDQPFQPEGTPPPPPPGGQYPAPPPPAGAYLPPPPGQAPALPADAYTPWITRVLAYLIDSIPVAVIVGIGVVIELLTQETVCTSDYLSDAEELGMSDFCVTGNSTLGVAAFLVSLLAATAFAIWNYGYKQGTTGSSIGKAMMKFKVVSEKTGAPIGFGMSVVRQLAHILDSAVCGLGYLFPLWDPKRQTFADKIMTTVCLPLP